MVCVTLQSGAKVKRMMKCCPKAMSPSANLESQVLFWHYGFTYNISPSGRAIYINGLCNIYYVEMDYVPNNMKNEK